MPINLCSSVSGCLRKKLLVRNPDTYLLPSFAALNRMLGYCRSCMRSFVASAFLLLITASSGFANCSVASMTSYQEQVLIAHGRLKNSELSPNEKCVARRELDILMNLFLKAYKEQVDCMSKHGIVIPVLTKEYKLNKDSAAQMLEQTQQLCG